MGVPFFGLPHRILNLNPQKGNTRELSGLSGNLETVPAARTDPEPSSNRCPDKARNPKGKSGG